MISLSEGFMFLRLLLSFALLSVSLASLAQQSATAVPETCPVTKPYQGSTFIPPAPYPAKTDPTSFWFGSDRLWTSLPKEGMWKLGHYAPDDPTFGQKLAFWRQGIVADGVSPVDLNLTGKRLDSPAPPLKSDEPHAVWTEQDRSHAFIMTGISFPTMGCWEITAGYQGDELSFVVWITK